METHRNSILKNPECCQNLHMILRKRIRALFLYLLRKKKKKERKETRPRYSNCTQML